MRNKNSANLELYSEDIVLSAYEYIKRVLETVGLSDQDWGSFITLFPQDWISKLIRNVLIPDYNKNDREADLAEDEDEERMVSSHKSRRGKRFGSNAPMFIQFESNRPIDIYDLENDIKQCLAKRPKLYVKIRDFFLQEIQASNKNFNYQESKMYKKISKTGEFFGFGEAETEILYFTAIQKHFSRIESWRNHFNDDMSAYVYRAAVKATVSKLSTMMKDSSTFVQFGIVDSHRYREMELTDTYFQFLLNEEEEMYGLDLVKMSQDPTHPLESFLVPNREKEQILNLLKSDGPTKILLYGTPGSGKTEFAKSLIAQSHHELCIIDQHSAEDKKLRRAAVVTADRLGQGSDRVILVDEADDLLNESSGNGMFFFMSQKSVPEKKIWMNDFLDNLKCKIIFISNESHSIHSSVKRRFDYSLSFTPPDTKQRLYYWSYLLNLEGIQDKFSEKDRMSLAEEFPIGVGGISSSIKASKKIQDIDSRYSYLSTIQDVLSKQLKLHGKPRKKPMLANTPYDSSLLNTDGSLENLEMMISEYKNKYLNSDEIGIGSLCLLFHGKPGTGKTEYARYLSNKFELELIQKRSSDLQDPFVGMTEKHIAAAFQEAESKQAIFFLDEADSFFQNRENAHRSWEVSQTNEFLTWMENFRGIFIASTNLMKEFDPAAMRRFAWKMQFNPLSPVAKVTMMEKYFPIAFAKMSFLEKESVKDMGDLTPGDYRSVWNQLRFRDPESVTAEELLTALRREVSYKPNMDQPVIGFN